MKKYSLYLLDFDGTLFDTAESLKEVYRLSFAKYGIVPSEEDYLIFITMSLPRAMAYKGLDPKYKEEFCNSFNTNVLDRSVYAKTKTYSDTLEFFKYVKEHNINIGIVTGSSSTRVKGVLDFYKLDFSYLKACVGNESYTSPKPDAEPILVALKRLNYMDRKSEVLYVGDAKQDEECAHNAGVDYIQIKRSHNNRGEINLLLDLF